uniref:DNA polymerase III subunit delta n=1 Tax=Schlesneria paludicola TaxID=360056 RepID=A0A7C4LLK6_9PLAN
MTTLWHDFRGHAEVRGALARAVARGRLAQAYLFWGPEGIGKRRFALHLAQSLLCRTPGLPPLEACGTCVACRPFRAGNHPDFHLVERDAGKRELTVEKFVGGREQRGKAGLCHELSLRPLPGGRKIGVIDDADTLNEEAANALLKTLEEPPDGATLILIAANVDALLPTIRSRCQPVAFAPLQPPDLAALIEQQGLAATPTEVAELTALAGGSLAVARQLAAPELRALRRRLLSELSRHRWDGMALGRALAEGIEQLGHDAAEQRLAALWLVRFAVEFYRQCLLAIAVPHSFGPSALAEAVAWSRSCRLALDEAVDLLAALLDRCLAAAAQIEQNGALNLCLEALCADLSRLIRTALPSA